MKTILITGINGFLGSSIAMDLEKDYNIIGLEYSIESLYRISDRHYKVYSSKDGISGGLFQENKVDIIIHCATSFGRQNESLNSVMNTNFLMSFELLNLAIKNECPVFINTDTVIDRFTNAYALTKRHFQEWLFFRKAEIKVINIKLEHFYGPGAGSTNFITAMIERLKNNETSIDLTLGEQLRDFIFIDDVVYAFRIVLQKNEEINEMYNEFQAALGQVISIKQLMEKLKQLISSSSVLNFGAIPYRQNELMHSFADNSSLMQLGWYPRYSLESGLKRTLNN